MRNVYLVGLMGCGKSSMGRILAKKIHRRNVDTDVLVEEKEQLSVMDIFEKYGEAYFRDRETEALRALAKQRNRVVSCGGGVVLREENIELMRSSGTVIWLKRSPAKILQGKRLHLRPHLAKDPTRIYALEKEREPFYAKACHAEVLNEGHKEETLKALQKVIWSRKK